MDKKHEYYDVVIIGGGAAGLTAAIYTGRQKLNTLLIEKSLVGGLATYTSEIENYPGFPEGITGTELMKLFHRQAKNFGVKFKLTDVKSVNFNGEDKVVETFRVIYHSKSVIISTGGRPRLTGALGEEKFLFDKGISFCATCDATKYTNKTVIVIGSGDSALEEGNFLTKFAEKVILAVRRDKDKIHANNLAKEKAMKNSKIEFLWNSSIYSFDGDEHLTSVNIENSKTNEIINIPVDGCFLFIGYEPNTGIFKDKIRLSDREYIITNEYMETSVKGVFAVGDVREKSLRQVATAVGYGVIAGVEAENYISKLKS